jgi:hypothetical protein
MGNALKQSVQHLKLHSISRHAAARGAAPLLPWSAMAPPPCRPAKTKNRDSPVR